jgi:acyl CoA:acetate/3-ketoacid CoA transferase beta subunit
VITDLAVLDVACVTFHLVELAPGVGLEQVIVATDAPVIERTV